ncbi:GPP34 family phosphoprotein [Salinibacterium sp. ZJ454]|uniref:GOLPH3/VPS74 family protein n=1 Tax=Salinibacterium sp. ZJ454 TaxID=2708339 RepID=UPI001420BCEE|nr:GPP34 family phosphoprotein [Salinibacterium sp. ZJ454]
MITRERIGTLSLAEWATAASTIVPGEKMRFGHQSWNTVEGSLLIELVLTGRITVSGIHPRHPEKSLVRALDAAPIGSVGADAVLAGLGAASGKSLNHWLARVYKHGGPLVNDRLEALGFIRRQRRFMVSREFAPEVDPAVRAAVRNPADWRYQATLTIAGFVGGKRGFYDFVSGSSYAGGPDVAWLEAHQRANLEWAPESTRPAISAILDALFVFSSPDNSVQGNG